MPVIARIVVALQLLAIAGLYAFLSLGAKGNWEMNSPMNYPILALVAGGSLLGAIWLVWPVQHRGHIIDTDAEGGGLAPIARPRPSTPKVAIPAEAIQANAPPPKPATSAAIQTPTTKPAPVAAIQTPPPSPCCNVISMGTPIIGFLAALVFLAIVGFQRPDVQGGTLMLWTALSILGGFCFVGFILAIIALVRSERLWGLTSLGILLNAPLLLALLWAGLSELGNWLRFG